jgi:diguanylate cyclase (GGDEF)-like protein
MDMTVGRWLSRGRSEDEEPDVGSGEDVQALADAQEPAGPTVREERLHALTVLSLFLHSAGTQGELVSAFAERAPAATGAQFIYPLIVDSKRDVLAATALEGLVDPRLERAMDAFQEDLSALAFPLGATAARRLILEQGDVSVSESFRDLMDGVLPQEVWENAQATLGMKRVALAPMVVEDEPLGLIAFGFEEIEVDVELLELLAGHFTLALRALLAQEEAARFSDIDEVAWVQSRRYLLDALEAEIARAARYGRGLSLVLLDLDDFGDFNATYGQSMGDRLLRTAGTTIAEVVTAPETVARLKDDDFAVLLPETNRAAAVAATSRMLSSLAQVSIFEGEGPPQPLTASVAIVCFPEDGATARELLANASADLGQAKEERREQKMMESRRGPRAASGGL